jgi:hypothetical protein
VRESYSYPREISANRKYGPKLFVRVLNTPVSDFVAGSKLFEDACCSENRTCVS